MKAEDMVVGMSIIDEMYPNDVGVLTSIDGFYTVVFKDSTYQYHDIDLQYLSVSP